MQAELIRAYKAILQPNQNYYFAGVEEVEGKTQILPHTVLDSSINNNFYVWVSRIYITDEGVEAEWNITRTAP